MHAREEGRRKVSKREGGNDVLLNCYEASKSRGKCDLCPFQLTQSKVGPFCTPNIYLTFHSIRRGGEGHPSIKSED